MVKAMLLATWKYLIAIYLDFKKMKKWQKILWVTGLILIGFLLGIVFNENKNSRKKHQKLSEHWENDFYRSRMTQDRKDV